MKYLIWSNEHGAWWRAAKLGYTTVIADAGRHDEQEARTICDDANRYLPAGAQPNEVMVEAPGAAEQLRDTRQRIERLESYNKSMNDTLAEVAEMLGVRVQDPGALFRAIEQLQAARGRAEAAGRFMARKLDEQRAPLATAQRGRIEQLEAALQAVHDDLLERANTDSDGYKVVAVGNSVWIRVCDALDQTQEAAAMGKKTAEVKK